MKKAFKIFSIMFVIEIVLIAILDAMAEKISMATEPEETRTFYGWFGCLSPETKEVRLNIVKDIIKELE